MEQLSFFSIEKKIQNAITLLKMFEAKAIEMHPEGYYLCFSGGKDSQVIYELAKQAKVKFQAYYNVTTVDPPELVYFIRKMYPAVIINQPDTTMWELISQKHYPPTRRMRYCCSELKERGGKLIQIEQQKRKAEKSLKRKKRSIKDIESLFRSVKPVTGRFEKWLEYEVLKESQYIFYQYSRRKMIDCTCSHCKSEYQLERSIPRHNKEYVCPICKRKSIFKAKGKSGYFSDYSEAVKIEKASDAARCA